MSRLSHLDAILAGAVGEGGLPGVVAAVTDRSGLLYEGAFGRRGLDRPDPMTADTVFWIASMTKAVTTVALLQLLERGLVELDQPAARYAPALGAAKVLEGFDEAGQPRLRAPKRAVTLRHLLTHTSGYSYEFASPAMRQYLKVTGTPPTASGLAAALSAPLVADPGEAFTYGIGTDWVGRVVEEVAGARLDAYFAEHILGPLGMADTLFTLRPDQLARRATVHATREDGGFAPTAMVVPQQPEFFSGGGGLYGTAGDYLAFARMILGGGEAGGRRILKSETVEAMLADQLGAIAVPPMAVGSPAGIRKVDFFPGIGQGWSLAFLVNREASAEGRSAGSIAWGGYANTYYWIDPARGLAGTLMTQVVPFFDPKAVALFRAFETAVNQAA